MIRDLEDTRTDDSGWGESELVIDIVGSTEQADPDRYRSRWPARVTGVSDDTQITFTSNDRLLDITIDHIM